MQVSLTRERALVAAFALLLGSMAVLGGSAVPPLVPIPKLASMDQGSEVRVQGMLVDLWKRDDGAETLVLLDPVAGATVDIYCSRGVRDQPSSQVGIGDLLAVRGELAGTGALPSIYARSDGVEVVKTSEHVLTVTMLARNWPLFEGDRFKIAGILEYDPDSGSSRLFDSSRRISIALRCDGPITELGGREVLVDGTLSFDSCHMFMYIDVESLSAAF